MTSFTDTADNYADLEKYATKKQSRSGIELCSLDNLLSMVIGKDWSTLSATSKIGLINLVKEHSLVNSCPLSVKTLEKLSDKFLSLWMLSVFHRGDVSWLVEKIRKNFIGRKSHSEITNVLQEPAADRSDLLEQTMFMHLIEVVLDLYQIENSLDNRLMLNRLMEPLLMCIFAKADQAYLAYATYYGIDTKEQSAFHMLYRNELCQLVQVRRHARENRPAILNGIRNAAGQTREAHDYKELHKVCNELLHRVLTNESKSTYLCQLTCLIRSIEDESEMSNHRKYSTHLSEIQSYQLVSETEKQLTWKESDNKDFNESVAKRYEKGHDVRMLTKLFGNSKEGEKNSMPLPVWVPDGEISFLWFCAALIRVGSQNENTLLAWETGSNDSELSIMSIEICGSNECAELSLGMNAKEFLTNQLCLFNKQDGDPTSKAWSLVNFLQWLCDFEKPGYYCLSLDAEPLKGAAATMYEAIKDLETFNVDCFLKIIPTVADALEKLENIEQLEKAARIETFLLECLLRNGRSATYSLFFYPLGYDVSIAGTELPSAFVGGTFAGLEGYFYPNAKMRQDFHLDAVLDVMYPVLNFEVSQVMQADFVKYAEKSIHHRTSEEKQKTFESIRSVLSDLTELFGDARHYVFRVASILSVEWSGLFTKDLDAVIEPLFIDGRKKLEIDNRVGDEPLSVAFCHSIPHKELQKNSELLYHRLLYLARSCGGYGKDGETESLGNDKSFDISIADLDNGAHVNLFADQPFLKILTRIAVENPRSCTNLNILLKLLTYDTGDHSKGIHVAQLATALGLSGVKGDYVVDKKINTTDNEYDPTTENGVKNLIGLLENDHMRLFSTRQRNTELRPRDFLRALRFIGCNVLAGDDAKEENLKLEKWKVWLPESSEKTMIILELDCKGHFSSDVQSKILGFSSGSDSRYHDFRSNMDTIIKWVGGSPAFIECNDITAFKDGHNPTVTNPFAIIAYHRRAAKVTARTLWRLLV